jgi:hypothetical protein
MKIIFFTLLSLLSLSFSSLAQSDVPKDYKVVYSQGFNNDKATNDFEFSDASKWLISKNGKPGKSLKCLGTGAYASNHEGPSVVALLKGFELKDFVIEMDVVQNGKDFNLLDFCVFFGVKDKNNYCYAQIASKADRKSHNVFRVDGDKPVRLGQVNENGVIWRMNEWQNVRLERSSSDKLIKVYFDGQLVFQSTDENIEEGLIGFGSTSSALKIDNIKLSAPAFETSTQTIF